MRVYIQTRSGIEFDLEQPRHEDVVLGDIAHALSHINRFVGHAGGYSVAEHLVLCCREAQYRGMQAQDIRMALMHDAHEAYMGDIATPVKKLLGDAVEELESRLAHVVRKRFALPQTVSEAVHGIDCAAARSEALQHLGSMEGPLWPGEEYGELHEHLSPKPWAPAVAERTFLAYCKRWDVL